MKQTTFQKGFNQSTKVNINQITLWNSFIQHHHLIINADDFGYSQPRNKGILQLIKTNKIKSISVLVNSNHIAESSKHIKQFIFTLNQNNNNNNLLSKLSVGLHFNLTQGLPLSISTSSNNNCQLISSQTKQFKGKSFIYQYFNNLANQSIDLQVKQFINLQVKQFIKSQFRLQIQKFINLFSFRPSHIDGHNHVHVIPEIANLIAPIMRQNGVYKVRLPKESINSDVTKFPLNTVFSSNAQKSQRIFKQHNIIYPTHFIGLEEINQLNAQRINDQINSIIQINQATISLKVIQLMSHPGYADPNQGDQFNRSQNRQVQMNSLKSLQFQQKILNHPKLKLSNFNLLSPPIQINHKKRILLYSKMNSGSGNWTTSLRLQQIFQTLGYTVYLRSIQENLHSQYQAQSLKQFLIQFKITLIVGINLTRSAKLIYQATRSHTQITNRVPYIFVVAGTDANIYFNTQQAVETLRQPIRQCSLLLSLSQSMMQLTRQFLENKLGYNKENNKPLILLGQSSNILTYESKQQVEKQNVYKCLKQNYNLSVINDKYIVFPASFRAVKDIQFLLKQFNFLISKYKGLRIFILGPILNQQYYENCLSKLGNVQYLGSLEKQLYVELLKNALFLVNSSVSQGQCCSIQEGLEVGQICVVRNNQGNAQLIKHKQTGFLFSKPQQFLSIAEIILQQDNVILIKQVRQNAILYHRYNFSIEAEAKNYKQIFNTILPSDNKIFTYPDVHPVSEVNLRLYDQIPSSILNQWFQSKLNLKKQQNSKRVIDIGCGSGIFSFNVLRKFNQKYKSHIQLQLYDFDNFVLSNCYYNCLQESQSIGFQTKCIKIKNSDMFQNISNAEQGNMYIANLPQTPFQNQKARPDRNGGQDSLKYNKRLIRQFSKFNNGSILIMLYSYMSYPEKFFNLLQELDLQIRWRSERINHQILSKTYDSIEQNLSSFLKNHIKQGRAQVQIKQNENGQQIFYVPAQILCIQKKRI